MAPNIKNIRESIAYITHNAPLPPPEINNAPCEKSTRYITLIMRPDEIKLRARIFVYARRRNFDEGESLGAAIRRELLSADYTGRHSQRIVHPRRIERETCVRSLSLFRSAVSYIEIIVTDREQCFHLPSRRALHKRDFLSPQV